MSRSDYRTLLLGLLPPVSYARNAPKVRAQADIDARMCHGVDMSAATVSGAVLPQTAGSLLPDWERVLGLAATGDEAQRITAAIAKINETGGLSIPYFVRLAAAFGYDIAIRELQPFRAGVNRAGDRLAREDIMWVWRVETLSSGPYSAEALKRLIRDLKPAHTEVYFV
ncbi:putative phage tail protein [Bergeriella denitrificans]|uniref:Phage protein n=1 Tax=Bergeriella denitrificans TaxID=494 RepID=A0A378UG98_BERDE|nr:putative phage tail protein [Bergeriella denitrificans]STZ76346.1 phage protein [Bergeriella denitrificans]